MYYPFQVLKISQKRQFCLKVSKKIDILVEMRYIVKRHEKRRRLAQLAIEANSSQSKIRCYRLQPTI